MLNCIVNVKLYNAFIGILCTPAEEMLDHTVKYVKI